MLKSLMLLAVMTLATACHINAESDDPGLPPVTHVASQCPADYSASTYASSRDSQGMDLTTADYQGTFHFRVDGQVHTLTMNRQAVFYKGGCSNDGYIIHMTANKRHASIELRKTSAGYDVLRDGRVLQSFKNDASK